MRLTFAGILKPEVLDFDVVVLVGVTTVLVDVLTVPLELPSFLVAVRLIVTFVAMRYLST